MIFHFICGFTDREKDSERALTFRMYFSRGELCLLLYRELRR